MKNSRFDGACVPGVPVRAFDAFYASLDQYTLAGLIVRPRPMMRQLRLVR